MAPEDIAGGEPARRGGAGVPPGAPAPGPDLRTALLIVVAVVLIGWALRAMAVVAVPLVAAVLIALAVMPVRDRVRARVPSWLGWLGIVAAMALILVVLGLFFGGIWLAAQRVVGEFSNQAGPVLETLEGGTGGGQDDLAEGAAAGAAGPALQAAEEEAAGGANEREAAAGGATEPEAAGEGAAGGGGEGIGGLLGPGSAGEILRTLGRSATGAASGVAAAILNSAVTLVAGLVLIVFFTLLILLESEDWGRKLRTVARPRTEWRLTESAGVIAGKVRAYLFTQAALGATSATLYFVWLTIWGVDLKIVWVLLIFLMNFIPNLGSLIGGTLPVAYTLLTQGLGHAIGVGAGILVIEQVMGNFVGPRVQSRSIALSPLVILVSLLVWGWIWGIAGALLAVPVTTALAVLGSHVPALRPWALLLTDKTTMRGLDEVTRPE